jgi:hypothetical protein
MSYLFSINVNLFRMQIGYWQKMSYSDVVLPPPFLNRKKMELASECYTKTMKR